MARLKKAATLVALILFATLVNAANPGPTVAEKRLMSSGVRIVSRFDSVSGLRAIVADNGKDRRLFYITPDGKSLIAGLVFDETGRNVTTSDMGRAGIANGNGTNTLTQLEAQQVWKKVETLRSLRDGSQGNVLYVFIDPRCNFCHQLMSQVRPHISAGRIQVRWLPVAILSESSKGLTEALYRVPNGTQAIRSLEAGQLQPLPQSQAVRLNTAKNLLAMRDTGSTGVPVLVYRVGTRVVVSTGVPSDAELASIVGGTRVANSPR